MIWNDQSLFFFTWNECLLTGTLVKSLAASANAADLVDDGCFLQVCTLILQGHFCLRNCKAPGFFLLIWRTFAKGGCLIMLPTCEKKKIFLDPHPIDCFLCNESTGFASWWCHSLLFRSKYLPIHSWTALHWMLVWGANWLDYHTVVTSSLKLSGALTARGVTDTNVFFFYRVTVHFHRSTQKKEPLVSH